MNQPQINIVVPLYNEEEVFPALISRLERLLDNTKLSIEFILVDDGSEDGTARLMRELSINNAAYHSIFLSRNFGHQLALSAGLNYVNASEGVFILDGDLQDPPEMLDEFYSYLRQGYDVVYAVRRNRKESWLKKLAYKSFYTLLKRVAYIDLPLDSGDFSLVSRRVVDHLNRLPEQSRFIRGMRSWVGFQQIGIPYDRDARHSGRSKYSFRKLLKLALNGLINFSEFPIKFITNLGLLVMTVSGIYLLYTLIRRLFFQDIPEGFTALLFTIILFGGMQLFALGLIGEYVLRIFFQVKGRPLFIVKERIFHTELEHGEKLL